MGVSDPVFVFLACVHAVQSVTTNFQKLVYRLCKVHCTQLIFKVRNLPTTIPAAQPVKEMNTEAVSVHRKNKEEVNLCPSKPFKVDKNREA